MTGNPNRKLRNRPTTGSRVSRVASIQYEAQIRPRSGLALKYGIILPNSPGTIDEDFRGEVGVVLINHGAEPFRVMPGMRIAQLIIARYERCEVSLVDELEDTERGDGGYGSTGV